MQMKAMIFAAGIGSRLKPITDTLPKALVPICGEPLLLHLIKKLKRYGYNDAVINLHHFAQKIRDYVEQEKNFGINISFSDESDLLRNTGGAIKHAADYLKGNEPFMVHNVDILSNLDFDDFFNDVLSDYQLRRESIPEVINEKIIQKACKSAIKAGMKLSNSEVDSLVKLLNGNINLKCPHGRPIAVRISRTEIDKWFKRIV